MAYEDWLGDPVADPTGRRYATLDALFVGKTSGRPEYAILALADGRRVAVPLDGARPDADAGELVLPLDPARVYEAPAVRGEVDHVPPAAGAQIRAFFGLGDGHGDTAPTETLPTTPVPAAPPAPAPTVAAPADDVPAEVTLSREELVVDTQARAVERVRLRKVVVSEEVTVAVTLHHEELRIEREPIDEPAQDGLALERGSGDAQLVDGALDFVLMAEEPVVGKRVRPVERVRVHRDTVVEERLIDEQVRVEQVEVDQEPITEERTTP